MIKYLRKAFDSPDLTGWNDATGHVTLIKNGVPLHGSYFQWDLDNSETPAAKVIEVNLWRLK